MNDTFLMGNLNGFTLNCNSYFIGLNDIIAEKYLMASWYLVIGWLIYFVLTPLLFDYLDKKDFYLNLGYEKFKNYFGFILIFKKIGLLIMEAGIIYMFIMVILKDYIKYFIGV